MHDSKSGSNKKRQQKLERQEKLEKILKEAERSLRSGRCLLDDRARPCRYVMPEPEPELEPEPEPEPEPELEPEPEPEPHGYSCEAKICPTCKYAGYCDDSCSFYPETCPDTETGSLTRWYRSQPPDKASQDILIMMNALELEKNKNKKLENTVEDLKLLITSLEKRLSDNKLTAREKTQGQGGKSRKTKKKRRSKRK